MLTLKQEITPSADGRYRLTTSLAVHPLQGDGVRVLVAGARVDLAFDDAATLLAEGAIERIGPPQYAEPARPAPTASTYTRTCSDGDYVCLRPFRNAGGEIIRAGARVSAGRDDAGELISTGAIARSRWIR